MPVYSVEGKLGTGKTKFAVWRARDAIAEGRRVASNVDLVLPAIASSRKATYVRIPDKPTADDLMAVGHGNPDSYNEDRNGIMILDELGTWLNSRSFGDKSRGPIIDWFIHARKLGWDVYLIVQDSGMIDRQVRDAMIEYQCRCVRLDKVKLPFYLGTILGQFNKRWKYLPRMHVVSARVGYGAGAIVAERWMYRGDDLHACYDTRQVFKHDPDAAAYSVLHPRRFEEAAPRPGRRWRGWMRSRPPQPVPPRPKLPIVELIGRLPPQERMAHWSRFARAGAI